MCNCHLFFTIQGCKDPKALGLEEGIIKDSQITVSSKYSPEHAAKNGRLNFQGQVGREASWAPKSDIDIDFLEILFVISNVLYMYYDCIT